MMCELKRTTEFRHLSIDLVHQPRNNELAWHPQLRVNLFAPNYREEHYERLQPQGGRRVGTCGSNHQRGRRAFGKRDSRIHQVSERRSGSGRAHALYQGAADGLAETYRVCRLHGAASPPAEVGEFCSQFAVTPRRRVRFVSIAMLLIVLIAIILLSGCGQPKQVHVSVPPPPAATTTTESAGTQPAATSNTPAAKESAPAKSTAAKEGADADLAEPSLLVITKPAATETGLASWYGPPYHNRRGSNGEVYNMHAMTAAHRTYPLGSIVRVTNLKTGHSALVRITDRGPFIPGRVLDLSLAAARKIDVYLPGIAEVKVEVMQTPAPLETGGKWAVQIGGFPDGDAAAKLADQLTRRYRTAKVLRFASPAGDWWIRVRVLGDDRQRARDLVAETETPEGAVFLVRLD